MPFYRSLFACNQSLDRILPLFAIITRQKYELQVVNNGRRVTLGCQWISCVKDYLYISFKTTVSKLSIFLSRCVSSSYFSGYESLLVLFSVLI